jgi:hypothetical protein
MKCRGGPISGYFMSKLVILSAAKDLSVGESDPERSEG